MGAHASHEVIASSIIVAKGDGLVNGDVRRAPRYADQLKSVQKEGMDTLYSLFKCGSDEHPDRPCMGYRQQVSPETVGDFTWMTYRQIQKRVDDVGAGIQKLGLVPPNADGVGAMILRHFF